MEPIIEEGDEIARISAVSTRLHERFTSEQIDTLVSTVPQSSVPDSWPSEQNEVDPRMSSSYITEALPGATNARGTTYSYAYESHLEPNQGQEAMYENETSDGIERRSTQTQKVTRMTKVTTTRSVHQMPIDDPHEGYFFDANGHPLPVSQLGDYTNGRYSDRDELLHLGIDLSIASQSGNSPQPSPGGFSRYAVPGKPGVPQVVDVDAREVTLAWLRPDFQGSIDESRVLYQVQLRKSEHEQWQPAHSTPIPETQCTVTNLEPMGRFEFRVVAANSCGYGEPSNPCAPVHLRPRFVDHQHETGGQMAPPPGRPEVLEVGADWAVIRWDAPVMSARAAPVAGYIVEYRAVGTTTWLAANDHLLASCRHDVRGLRPNGEYEFRVLSRTVDGISLPSVTSGIVRIRPQAPARTNSSAGAGSHQRILPPTQPTVVEADSDWVRLEWHHSESALHRDLGYIVESREIGDPNWHATAQIPHANTHCTVEHLRPNSTYEFRVIAIRLSDGQCSDASPVSDVVQLRPQLRHGGSAHRGVPGKPLAPEYLDTDNHGDRITLCWMPAPSTLPVQFRDFQQDTAWYKVNDLLIHACKMTVGDLLIGHEYQFRVIARNVMGYSEPSDASVPITINARGNGSGVNFIEASDHGVVALLQDEIVRESPPIPDRDDSPPPIHRHHFPLSADSNLQWRDPTLSEVIDYLSSSDRVLQLNASGYLQHLTFHDNEIKEQTRELGGIPRLVRLLASDVSDIQRNACGCLKNLSFGKENDTNKRAIGDAGGVRALSALLQSTPDMHVKEELTGVLWNLSSLDELKVVILEQASLAIVSQVVVPGSGFAGGDARYDPSLRQYSNNAFRNGTGVLRNVSAASESARIVLRNAENLVESLIHFLTLSVQCNQVDSRPVENVVCILRNLTFRVEEMMESTGSARSIDRRSSRSLSAPSGSPKPLKKADSKIFGRARKKHANEHVQHLSTPKGAELLWQPDVVRLYLKLLQEASNAEVLEASAGALQNLAACQFEPAVQMRATVRTEKGLPVLVELLRLPDDRVVCSVTTALRNLALDLRNRELIGKYAMLDLVNKLPRADARQRESGVSDATIGAVLGILFETVRSSADFTRNLHEQGGTERLRVLARSYPLYGTRVCRYASQVLYVMWQHKELHDGFRRSGLKESDFYSGTASRARETTTLARPIANQGAERPTALRTDRDETASQRYGTIDNARAQSLPMTPVSMSARSSVRPDHRRSPAAYDQVGGGEPLYAAVQKRNGQRPAGDSWV